MDCTETLALLAVRRLGLQSGLLVNPSAVNGKKDRGAGGESAQAAGADWPALVRALQQAIDELWLTVELFICREILEPVLSSQTNNEVCALCDCPVFAHLQSAVATPARPQIWRDLHSCRKTGPLSTCDLELDHLQQQLADHSSVTDLPSLQESEWQTLWQLANSTERRGLSSLKFLFQLHSDQGDSLLVRLVSVFLAHELKLQGEVRNAKYDMRNSPEGTLPEELVAWLAREYESLTALLDKVSAGQVSVPAHQSAEVQAQIRNALSWAQAGEYGRAIRELSGVIEAYPE